MDSILKNFRNPWEDENWVLQTNVLDTSVLDNHVLSDLKPKPNVNESQGFSLGNLYQRGSDKRLKYSKQIRAFELFASSTIGKKWFKSRVPKSYTFTPYIYKGGGFIAKEDGYHYKEGIKTKLYITNIGKKLKAEGSVGAAVIAGAYGLTRGKLKNGKLEVTIYLNDDSTNQSRSKIKIMEALDTWAHEILFHGELYENIFINEGRLATKTEAGSEHQHNDIEVSSYEKEILKILIHGRDTLGEMSNYTDEMLKEHFKGL
jgi:hypothetical protein